MRTALKTRPIVKPRRTCSTVSAFRRTVFAHFIKNRLAKTRAYFFALRCVKLRSQTVRRTCSTVGRYKTKRNGTLYRHPERSVKRTVVRISRERIRLPRNGTLQKLNRDCTLCGGPRANRPTVGYADKQCRKRVSSIVIGRQPQGISPLRYRFGRNDAKKRLNSSFPLGARRGGAKHRKNSPQATVFSQSGEVAVLRAGG